MISYDIATLTRSMNERQTLPIDSSRMRRQRRKRRRKGEFSLSGDWSESWREKNMNIDESWENRTKKGNDFQWKQGLI